MEIASVPDTAGAPQSDFSRLAASTAAVLVNLDSRVCISAWCETYALARAACFADWLSSGWLLILPTFLA
jgi:hypothetical protein